jgi:uncharacterized protein (TIGR02996 family)
MNEETLWSSLRAAPAQDGSRHVYADWLEHQGRPAEAAVIRAEIAVHAAPGDPIVRESLHQSRATAPAPWLLRFEQPSLLRTPPLPLEAAWWSVDLGEARPASGTYQRYSYASLPDVDPELACGLGWLEELPTHERDRPAPWEEVQRRAEELGYALPGEFVALFREQLPLREVIRSCTDCTFLLDPELWGPVEHLGGLLVPFYNDSQSCVSWALWLHRSGAQAVLSFHLEFGEDEDSEEIPPDSVRFNDNVRAGWFAFASPSLSSFVYRMALENQIWFGLFGRDEGPLTPAQRRYLDHYRREQ